MTEPIPMTCEECEATLTKMMGVCGPVPDGPLASEDAISSRLTGITETIFDAILKFVSEYVNVPSREVFIEAVTNFVEAAIKSLNIPWLFRPAFRSSALNYAKIAYDWAEQNRIFKQSQSAT